MIGILVVALNQRGLIVAPAAVQPEIAADLGLTAGQAGLLTAAPVVMFGVLTPFAAIVIRRAGADAAVMIALSGTLVGTIVRLQPGFVSMIAGTAIMGAALTIGNIVAPVVIRRDFPPEHVSMVTAAYTAMINGGSLLTTLATAPLAASIGWPLSIAVWALFAVAGLVVWAHIIRRRTARPRVAAPQTTTPATRPSAEHAVAITGPTPVVGTETRVWRLPVAWLLAIAFACQSISYWVLSAWLPTMLRDTTGADAALAGAVASIFQGVALVGAFVVPVLARISPAWVPGAVVSVSWLTVTIGLFVAPQFIVVWLIAGGVAHAGGFVVIFTLMARVSRSDRQAAGMSALVQGVGYSFAAIGPPLFGMLHEVSGNWELPLASLIAVATVFCVSLLASQIHGRPGRTR